MNKSLESDDLEFQRGRLNVLIASSLVHHPAMAGDSNNWCLADTARICCNLLIFLQVVERNSLADVCRFQGPLTACPALILPFLYETDDVWQVTRLRKPDGSINLMSGKLCKHFRIFVSFECFTILIT